MEKEMYQYCFEWYLITAAHAFVTALDRSTVQVFNGSTPRSMDAQLSLYSSTTPRRNTDLSQWPEDFDTRQQQTRTGNVPITSSHARFWLDGAPAMHELHVILRRNRRRPRDKIVLCAFQFMDRHFCMNCTWFLTFLASRRRNLHIIWALQLH